MYGTQIQPSIGRGIAMETLFVSLVSLAVFAVGALYVISPLKICCWTSNDPELKKSLESKECICGIRIMGVGIAVFGLMLFVDYVMRIKG
jgi:hypothetical protein